MAVLALLVFQFFRWALFLPDRAVCLLTLLTLISYTGVVEVRNSVARAVVMSVVYLAGRMLYRKARPLNLLAAAAWGILCVSPRQIEDVGFHLSFLAMVGILLFMQPIALRLPKLPLNIQWLLAMTLSAQLAVLPIVALTFNRVTPGAVLLNLWVVPLLEVLMVLLTLFVFAGAWAGPLGGWLATGLSVALDAIRVPTEAMSAWPGFSFRVADPPAWLLGCIFLGLCFVGLPAARRFRPALAVLTVIFLLTAAIHPFSAQSVKAPRLTMIDVGQGQAILLELPGEDAWLFDGGGSIGNRFDVGGNVVSPYLWSRGIERLAVVCATTPRADHCYGLDSVLRNFRVGELWLPKGVESKYFETLKKTAREEGIPVRPVGEGFEFNARSFRLRALGPPTIGKHGKMNSENNSIVLDMTLGKTRVLLASDIGKKRERELLENYPGLRCNLLIAPKHGSNNSGSGEFLKALKPEDIWISVGNNPWGWPTEEALGRFRMQDVVITRTDEDGMLTREF